MKSLIDKSQQLEACISFQEVVAAWYEAHQEAWVRISDILKVIKGFYGDQVLIPVFNGSNSQRSNETLLGRFVKKRVGKVYGYSQFALKIECGTEPTKGRKAYRLQYVDREMTEAASESLSHTLEPVEDYSPQGMGTASESLSHTLEPVEDYSPQGMGTASESLSHTLEVIAQVQEDGTYVWESDPQAREDLDLAMDDDYVQRFLPPGFELMRTPRPEYWFVEYRPTMQNTFYHQKNFWGLKRLMDEIRKIQSTLT